MKQFLFLFFISFTLTACNILQSELPVAIETTMPAVDVEVDIFSGQPNPIFSLTEIEAEELGGLIANLPESDASFPSIENRLGFRGFILHDLRVGSFNATVRVIDDMVLLSDEQGNKTYLYDAEQIIFDRLLIISGTHLSTDLQDIISNH